MPFEPKERKTLKNESVYKTIYLRRELAEQVERIAISHDTSFNNVVISMIEQCLAQE